jgi:signal transduction histidine kinase
MKRPEDLADAMEVMRDELRKLGLSFSVCGIAIVDREAASDSVRMISATPSRTAKRDRLSSVDLPLSEFPEAAALVEVWSDQRVGLLSFEPGDCTSSFRDLAARQACERPLASDLRFLLNVPFSHGAVFVGGSDEERPSEDDVRTLTEFADAISVAYQRFVDVQSLEKRTQELQDTQLQLIQSEKMASLGQLVAGVAHELNSPMGAIYSNNQSAGRALARLLSELPERPSELSATMKQLQDMNAVNETACRRIIEIVSNLRKFARLDESEWKRVDLREGIDETLALVEHQTRDRIEIVRAYEELPAVACFPGQLNQVFMNLVVNAIQAIEGRGRIEIAASHENDRVVVRFRDDGQGIPETALGRVFDPGYTTKGVGVGTGLGLSIAYRIVSNHGGRLTVTSEVGKGAEFVVSIPVDRERPASISPASAYTTVGRT